jgi:hypothetical protein
VEAYTAAVAALQTEQHVKNTTNPKAWDKALQAAVARRKYLNDPKMRSAGSCRSAECVCL